MALYIRKISGHKELFDPTKFAHSLRKAGASQTLINQLIRDIESDKSLRTTRKIYAYALDQLYKSHPPTASRYNIKQALLQLGPAGFPFEQFITHIFTAQGYHTQTNQIISGHCSSHEIDIVAIKDDKQHIIECKYHNRQNMKSDVKVPLYVKARLDDINQEQKTNTMGWIVTNTRFTSRSIEYAECAHIQLLSWDYPAHQTLINFIQKYNLYPITTLVNLDKQEKQALIKQGFLLCKDAPLHENTLKAIGLDSEKIKAIILQATQICQE